MSRTVRALSALTAFCLLAAGSTLASMPAAASGQAQPVSLSPTAPAPPKAGQSGERWRPQTHYTPRRTG